jgi:cation transport protein ChaC
MDGGANRVTADARRGGLALTEDLVRLCHRDEPDPGPDPQRQMFTDAEFDAAAARILAEAGSEPIWVFAYGSLIWKPALQPIAQRRATAIGWHRSFCLEMRRWRGSPQQPGLMMALRRGGSCVGIAQRLGDADPQGQLLRLLRREISGPAGLASLRWIDLQTSDGPLRALCFYAEPDEVAQRQEMPPETVASILARACGHIGSGAEYLFRTIAALEAAGIRDPHLWHLQQLVAEEIRAIHAKPV